MEWEEYTPRGWVWLWSFSIPPSPIPPGIIWPPDPGSVNSWCFSASPSSGAGASCESSACSPANGTGDGEGGSGCQRRVGNSINPSARGAKG